MIVVVLVTVEYLDHNYRCGNCDNGFCFLTVVVVVFTIMEGVVIVEGHYGGSY